MTGIIGLKRIRLCYKCVKKSHVLLIFEDMDNQLLKNTPLVLSVTRRIIKPLAKLLLAHGVTLPAFLEIIKQVLIEVAEDDFPVKGKTTTDSRISVLTGVHRKDVKRLRGLPDTGQVVPKSISLGSQVINTWVNEKRWQGSDRKPMVLPRTPPRKGMKSFETLVETVSKDVRPRAVLDELVRSGIVEIVENYVHLKTEAFIPREGLEESLYYLERGVRSHLSAAVDNVQSETARYFDRMVHYDHIQADSLDKLVSDCQKQGMEFLKIANRAAKKASNKDSSASRQFTLGVYIYHEDSTSIQGSKEK